MARYNASRYQYETSPRKLQPEYEPIKKKYPKKSTATKRVNNEQRNIDSATDVLSFPMLDFVNGEMMVSDADYFEGDLVLGDIVLSFERAKEQSEEYGHSFEREVAFLSVHSVLHLLGYDHEISEEEDKIMREKQRAVMSALGLEIK